MLLNGFFLTFRHEKCKNIDKNKGKCLWYLSLVINEFPWLCKLRITVSNQSVCNWMQVAKLK